MLFSGVSLHCILSNRFQLFLTLNFFNRRNSSVSTKRRKLQTWNFCKKEPCASCCLSSDKKLKFRIQQYVLAKTGDYWSRTFQNHFTEDLFKNIYIPHPAVFRKMKNRSFSGISVGNVDDTLPVVAENYISNTKMSEDRLQCKERHWDKIQIAGRQTESENNCCVNRQSKCINKLQKLSDVGTVSPFKTSKSRLAWSSKFRTGKLLPRSPSNSSCQRSVFQEITNLLETNQLCKFLFRKE